MKNTRVTLVPLEADDREQFILDNQWAFKYGAMEEFGERDRHRQEGKGNEAKPLPVSEKAPVLPYTSRCPLSSCTRRYDSKFPPAAD